MISMGNEEALGPGDWEVGFYGRDQTGVRVSVDVVSGETIRFPVRRPEGPAVKPECRK